MLEDISLNCTLRLAIWFLRLGVLAVNWLTEFKYCWSCWLLALLNELPYLFCRFWVFTCACLLYSSNCLSSSLVFATAADLSSRVLSLTLSASICSVDWAKLIFLPREERVTSDSCPCSFSLCRLTLSCSIAFLCWSIFVTVVEFLIFPFWSRLYVISLKPSRFFWVVPVLIPWAFWRSIIFWAWPSFWISEVNFAVSWVSWRIFWFRLSIVLISRWSISPFFLCCWMIFSVVPSAFLMTVCVSLTVWL